MFVRTQNGKIYDVDKLIKQVKTLGIYASTMDREEYELASIATNENRETMLGWQRRVKEEADTIHELVDAYWLENVHYSDPMYEPSYSHACHVLKDWLNSDIELNTDCLKDITMYGSIYVKGQGWTHVSKLSIDKLGKITEELL